MSADAGVGRLVEWSGRVTDLANGGHITEQHAVEFLADAAADNPVVLRVAAIRVQQDPDSVPLIATLLERAADAAEHPAAVRSLKPPSAPGPQ